MINRVDFFNGDTPVFPLFAYSSKIQPSVLTNVFYFGQNSCISGDGNTAAVIASTDIYLFTKSGGVWTERQKITPSAGEGQTSLQLSYDGSILVTAGYTSNTLNAGNMWVYIRSGNSWSFAQKFRHSDPASADFFGISFKVSKNLTTLVSGASTKNNSTGAAYMFTSSNNGQTWSQAQKLTAPDAQIDDKFGSGTAISQDGAIVFISAHQEDGGAGNPHPNSGCVYIYKKSGSTWSYIQTLRQPNLTTQRAFGEGVCCTLDGSTVFVSSNETRGFSCFTTSDFTTWSFVAEVTASSNLIRSSGITCSGTGDRVVCGSEQNGNVLAVYNTANMSTWYETIYTAPVEIISGDAFGYGTPIDKSISITEDGNHMVVGAMYHDEPAKSNCGAVYSYDI